MIEFVKEVLNKIFPNEIEMVKKIVKKLEDYYFIVVIILLFQLFVLTIIAVGVWR
tara:strand:+ start:6702 stop:6866 length:165 start_codon:yes stop_codon:yes gene_type:complete